MEASSDLFLPAVLFTLLAIIVAAVITGKNKSRAPSKCTTVVNGEESHNNETHHPETVLQSNANTTKDETIPSDSSPDHDEVCRSDCTDYRSSSGWEELDSSQYGMRNALRDYSQSPDAEEKPLKYMAGMLRASQLEKMMTKEELEEEQRVQRDQLAAIFQLLRDKQETFGDVTQSDLEEQLKLYSI
ncbi:matrix-remodeling-associated protein 7-like [Triplophysa dalaica]|uniref:matrix-remodeling-associated protein 7-like n=1 Tax=Triplophysa dalaica TaxID=1582913 RepID=UPI0024DF9297|nr:matrix-remodeling-associated protein 7-like [Triplophysa dalaica]